MHLIVTDVAVTLTVHYIHHIHTPPLFRVEQRTGRCGYWTVEL